MLVAFTIYPLVYNNWLSFHEYVPFMRLVVPVGWDSWNALMADTRFWESPSVTFT